MFPGPLRFSVTLCDSLRFSLILCDSLRLSEILCDSLRISDIFQAVLELWAGMTQGGCWSERWRLLELLEPTKSSATVLLESVWFSSQAVTGHSSPGQSREGKGTF